MIYIIMIQIIIVLIFIPAWFNHIIYCINTELWGFLIAGALFFPIGVIHGIELWFGYFQ